MLRIHMIVPFLFLICSALARQEVRSPNQVEGDSLSEDATVEGRASGGCGTCGGGLKPTVTTTHVKPDIHDLIPSHHELLAWVLGSIPVILFNILGLVLLVLLLKKLLSDDTDATGYPPTSYASPSSYADPLTYNRRVTNAIEKYNVIENK